MSVAQMLALALLALVGGRAAASTPEPRAAPSAATPAPGRPEAAGVDAAAVAAAGAAPGCTPDDAECWPTAAEIAAFRAELDPLAPRILHYGGAGTPRPCAVPIGSPGDQPLYGALGVANSSSLEALYVNDTDVRDAAECMKTRETRSVCLAACRNNPLEGYQPQFVVWPLSAKHVQAAVRFAKSHGLTVSVLGTGHDFMNRHSAPGGMLIRTTLLKSQAWDESAAQAAAAGSAWTEGSAKLGAGLTFSEVAQSAAKHGRVISQGWGITVGIAGWSMGGGHGPFANSAGMGVDNILAAEVVTASGVLVVASNATHRDLWWALRGGGGSTWGVVVSFTLRAHLLPKGGLAGAGSTWSGNFCADNNEGGSSLNASIAKVLSWKLLLSPKWSGISFITPTKALFGTACGATYSFMSTYVFMGPTTDPEFVQRTAELDALAKSIANLSPKAPKVTITPWASQWARATTYGLEPIIPVPIMAPTKKSVGGVPSVLVSRGATRDGALTAQLSRRLADCALPITDPLFNCARQELYQDITGNAGAPDATAHVHSVSISPAFRDAFMHIVVGAWDEARMQTYYDMKSSSNSYMSESAYDMPGWRQRLWGSNHQKLLEVKTEYDPRGLFWCRHCVGDRGD